MELGFQKTKSSMFSFKSLDLASFQYCYGRYGTLFLSFYKILYLKKKIILFYDIAKTSWLFTAILHCVSHF